MRLMPGGNLMVGVFQFMTLDEVCGMKDMGEDKQFIAE